MLLKCEASICRDSGVNTNKNDPCVLQHVLYTVVKRQLSSSILLCDLTSTF